jgi:hypothetical protein
MNNSTNYLSLFTLHHLALLSDWLEESTELYIDVYLPRSAASSTIYLIRSMNDFKSLIAKQSWPEIEITIFKYFPYSIRGIANEMLLKETIERTPQDQSYDILELRYYPDACIMCGGGIGHTLLESELREVFGSLVAVGQEPAFSSVSQWASSHSNEVFRLILQRNYNHYQKFAETPDQFKWLQDLWEK